MGRAHTRDHVALSPGWVPLEGWGCLVRRRRRPGCPPASGGGPSAGTGSGSSWSPGEWLAPDAALRTPSLSAPMRGGATVPGGRGTAFSLRTYICSRCVVHGFPLRVCHLPAYVSSVLPLPLPGQPGG